MRPKFTDARAMRNASGYVGPNSRNADVARVTKATSVALIDAAPLHPDTAPDAIAAAQRDAVRAVPGWRRRTYAELSVAAVLPVDVVARRVDEIRTERKRA